MIIYLLLVVESLALQRIRAYQTSVMDLFFLFSVSFLLLLARYLLPDHLAIVSFNVSNAPSCLDLGWDAVTNVHNSIGEVATNVIAGWSSLKIPFRLTALSGSWINKY